MPMLALRILCLTVVGSATAFQSSFIPTTPAASRCSMSRLDTAAINRCRLNTFAFARNTRTRNPIRMQQMPGTSNQLAGEDAAVFELSAQSIKSWAQFVGVFSVVMAALFVLWLNPSTGFGDEFAASMLQLAGGNSSLAMLIMLGLFGTAHSGLAGLRASAEQLINSVLGTQGVGERVWRVLFGVVSLPLAVSCVVFFINHRYDGIPLWNLKLVPGVHDLCWALSFISFWFLYPSTFNLLEVAAVDKPKFHMWETGIMRITRHPQMIGQLIWCVAHTVWIGNGFMLATSAGLMAHHLFGVWHGDRRLAARYGEAFEAVRRRTSVWPMVAVLEGRQVLPADYWREFARGPYAVIVVGTVVAYFAHPLLEGGSTLLHW